MLDRASGQLRDIRREAERTDRALLRAGASADMVGGPRAQRSYQNAERGLRRVNDQAERQNKLTGILRNRWVMIGTVVAGLLPLLIRLSGVVVQLGGSLIRAAGGAGVLGGGALGAFAAGLGSVMLVVKPLQDEFKKASQQMQRYTQAVDRYGASSKQAATQAQALNGALKAAPAGTARLLISLKALEDQWKRVTRASQEAIVRGALGAVGRARGALPQIAGIVNRNVQAAIGGAGTIIDRILSPASIRLFGQISQAFRRDVPPAANAVANLWMSFGQLIAVAAPFATRFIRDLDQWTKHFDRVTQDTEYLRYLFRDWVGEFRAWAALMGSMLRFFGTLFQMARGGRQEIGGITAAFNSWTQWLRDNPLRVARFFAQATQGAHDLGAGLRFTFGLLQSIYTGLEGAWQALRPFLAAIGGPLLTLLQTALTTVSLISQGMGHLGGPLTIVLRALNGILTTVNAILRHVPILGTVLAGALTVVGIVRMVTWMGRFTVGIREATASMLGLRTATVETAAATGALAGGGAARGAAAGVNLAALAAGAGAGGAFRGTVAEAAAGGRFAGLRAIPGRIGGAFRGGGIRGGLGAAGIATLIGTTALTMAPPGMIPGGRRTTSILGGAASGAAMGALAGNLIPIPGVGAGIGALGGALIGGGLAALSAGGGGGGSAQFQRYQRAVSGQTTSRVTGTRIGARGIPIPVTATQQHIGLEAALGREGGMAAHTSAQLTAQVRTLRGFLGMLAHDESAQAQAARANLQQQIALRRQEIPYVRAQERHASFMRGANLLPQLGGAYNIVNAARGPVAGMEYVRQQVLRRWATLGPEGQRHVAHAVLVWAGEMRRANPALSGEATRLVNSIDAQLATLGPNVQKVNNEIFTGSQREWRNIANAMVTPMEQAREAISSNLTVIQQRAVASLSAMGISPRMAARLVRGIEAGNASAAGLAGALGSGRVSGGGVMSPHSRGGRAAGGSMYDSIGIGGDLVGAGEMWVNRHTEARVDHMLGAFGTSLAHEVGSEGRPHAFPHRFATGGRGSGGLSLAGLKPGIANVANIVLGQFPGMTVTSTTGGRHAHDSYHYLGEAVDIAGGVGYMNTAARWIAANLTGSLLEGIHNAGLSVKNGAAVAPSFWGSTTWGQHRNHIHLAAGPGSRGATGGTGARGGGRGGGRINLAALFPGATPLAGVPGALVDQTGLEVSVATAQRLNAILGGGMPGPGVNAGAGAESNTQALARGMMLARGWPAAEWGALHKLWMGESGFNTLAKNPSSGAYGIPQSLPGSKMASAGRDWRTNPATQIAWGLNYIAGRYGSPSRAYSAWSARSPHWYREGGRFVARRPMLIGVGDTEEQVSITPTRHRGRMVGGATPSLHVDVSIAHISYHGRGDIKNVVKGEIRDALAELETEIRALGMVPEETITR